MSISREMQYNYSIIFSTTIVKKSCAYCKSLQVVMLNNYANHDKCYYHSMISENNLFTIISKEKLCMLQIITCSNDE